MSLALIPVSVSIETALLPGWGDTVITFRWSNPDGERRHHVEYVPPSADEDEILACIELVTNAVNGEWPVGRARGR